MKVNVGCGNDIRKGWVNLDFRDEDGVDVVADITEGMPFKDGECDELLCQDVLEHFPLAMTDKILSEWARVLRKGGYITIEVPNMELNFKHWILGETKCLPGQNMTERFSEIVFGKQDYVGNFHYQLFDRSRFDEILPRNGFEVIEYYERGRALGVKARKV